MPSAAALIPPFWTDGMTWASATARQVLGSLVTADQGTPSAVIPRPGVITGAASGLQVTPGSGMSVSAGAGYCAIPHPTPGNGTYVMGLMAQATLTVAAADPSSPRIDLVAAVVYDLGSSSSYCDVEVITGTPAASPAAPAAPAAGLVLAQVLVPASTATVTSGNIADMRTWTAPPGGIIPVAGASAAPAVTPSTFFYNAATGMLCRGTGFAHALAPVSLTQAAVVSQVTTSGGGEGITPGNPPGDPWGIGYGQTGEGSKFGGSIPTDGIIATQITASFTADGVSDYEMAYRWQLCVPAEMLESAATVTGGQVTFRLLLDGVAADFTDLFIADSPLTPAGGGMASWFTSASLGTTPPAGPHVATLAVVTSATNSTAADACGVLVGDVAGSGAALYSAPSGWLAALTAENCSLTVLQVPPA